MIPKIIHYCWFGKGEKPDIFYQCFESWKRYCPDYKIMEWNEDNLDVTLYAFMYQAYINKKYAFVSDVARLLVVYKYGGIYLDTDVELTSSLDGLLQRKSFFFFKNLTQIATGLGFGAVPNNEIVKLLLNSYSEHTFSTANLSNIACQNINTETIAERYGSFKVNGSTQVIEDNYFISVDEYNRIAKHYDQFSWKSPEQEEALKYARKNKKTCKLRKMLQNPQIYSFFQNHNLILIKKIYTFMVYDLFDYGVLYWLVRIYLKMINRHK